MALVASQRFMTAVQGKCGGRVVVERTRFPSGFGMARLAIGAEPRSRMPRVGGGVVVF